MFKHVKVFVELLIYYYQAFGKRKFKHYFDKDFCLCWNLYLNFSQIYVPSTEICTVFYFYIKFLAFDTEEKMPFL